MRATTTILLAGLMTPGFAQAMDCAATRGQPPLRPTVVAPVASELAAVYGQLGASGGVLSQAFDESLSVDQVLLRIRIESCQDIATATPAPGVVNPDDPAAYKPRTQFDNTPWRFNMSQNGKNMTADEFSAWMKSRGVRVARGAAPAIAASAVDGEPAAAGTAAPVPAGNTPGEPAAPATLPPRSVEAPDASSAAPAAVPNKSD